MPEEPPVMRNVFGVDFRLCKFAASGWKSAMFICLSVFPLFLFHVTLLFG